MNNIRQSHSSIVASSGVFQIEHLIETLDYDFEGLIDVSRSLEKIYGSKALLTERKIMAK